MSRILKIFIHPHKILRQRSKKIKDVKNLEVQELISNMIETMKENKGIGLAAVQVGKPLRLIVVATKDGPFILANPKIYWKSEETEIKKEGCLSLPKVWKKIERSAKIKVKGIVPSGKKIKITAEGLFARVIQHEVDHLDGILIIDY